MLKPVIRPATPEDLAGVLALYRQLNPGDPALDVAGDPSMKRLMIHESKLPLARDNV